jgi:hypothetical protein
LNEVRVCEGGVWNADGWPLFPRRVSVCAGGDGFLTRSLSAFGFSKPKKNQAKLGDDNSFYYNEELKMWVERGKEDEAKAAAAPPPPPPTQMGGGGSGMMGGAGFPGQPASADLPGGGVAGVCGIPSSHDTVSIEFRTERNKGRWRRLTQRTKKTAEKFGAGRCCRYAGEHCAGGDGKWHECSERGAAGRLVVLRTGGRRRASQRA